MIHLYVSERTFYKMNKRNSEERKSKYYITCDQCSERNHCFSCYDDKMEDGTSSDRISRYTDNLIKNEIIELITETANHSYYYIKSFDNTSLTIRFEFIGNTEDAMRKFSSILSILDEISCNIEHAKNNKYFYVFNMTNDDEWSWVPTFMLDTMYIIDRISNK